MRCCDICHNSNAILHIHFTEELEITLLVCEECARDIIEEEDEIV